MHAWFLIVYLAILIVLGVWKARKVKTHEDFALAGRGLSGAVLTGTLLATWIGTGSVFGNAQKAFQDGVSAFILPLSSAVGILVLFGLAARLRRMNHFTIQDILEERFGVVTRVLGTVALLAGYLIIVSYQYRAGASVVERILPDLSHDQAVYLVAAFVIAYTALAGMFSVAYTDLANGILMTTGLGVTLWLLLSQLGGPTAMFESLPATHQDPFSYSSARIISYLLPAFLLILGDANMYQRFFSAKDPAVARRSAAGMFFGVLLLDWLIIGVALCGVALVARGEMIAPENPAHAIVHIAFEALPPLLGALLSATVVAVVVSTADSYLLSPASSVVRDIYQRFLRPNADDKQVIRASRGIVVVLGLLALWLAFQSDEFFEVALFAYTLYGAAITPPLLAALFWKGATTAGAVTSMITGLGTAILWHFWFGEIAVQWTEKAGSAGLHEFVSSLDAALPAVLVSVLALVFVSKLTTNQDARPA
ncbi:MAG: SSS family solute:Na+ symporter [Candidatus Paceibacteria bacterium]|jgi:SSS family solute:Na+ symporter